MCLFADDKDAAPTPRVRRFLAVMVILLATASAELTLFLPRHISDFLRGLPVGIALGISLSTLVICARRSPPAH